MSYRKVVPFIGAAILVASMVPSALALQSAEGAGDSLVPAGSVLATPEEVALMGGTEGDVSAQRDAWKSLPRDVRAGQLALNRAEAQLAAPAFANIVEPTGAAPMVSPQTCGGAYYWSYYKLRGDGLTEQCFAGAAGTHTLANQMSDYGNTRNFRLQAAEYKGRTYYRIQTTYFWTLTRGPGDSNWYEFPDFAYDQHMYLLKVQLY